MSSHIGARCTQCETQSTNWWRGADPAPIRRLLQLWPVFRALDDLFRADYGEWVRIEICSAFDSDREMEEFLRAHDDHIDRLVPCDEYGKVYEK